MYMIDGERERKSKNVRVEVDNTFINKYTSSSKSILMSSSSLFILLPSHFVVTLRRVFLNLDNANLNILFIYDNYE